MTYSQPQDEPENETGGASGDIFYDAALELNKGLEFQGGQWILTE